MAVSKRKRESQQAQAANLEAHRDSKPKTDKELFEAIQQAAYFKAEQDGFRKPPTDYWLAAQDEMVE
jgi:hypothetical protein